MCCHKLRTLVNTPQSQAIAAAFLTAVTCEEEVRCEAANKSKDIQTQCLSPNVFYRDVVRVYREQHMLFSPLQNFVHVLWYSIWRSSCCCYIMYTLLKLFCESICWSVLLGVGWGVRVCVLVYACLVYVCLVYVCLVYVRLVHVCLVYVCLVYACVCVCVAGRGAEKNKISANTNK